MPAIKDCHTLTSYFLKQYEAKYGVPAPVNRHTARWGFDSVLLSMGIEQAKELIDYYLRTASPNRHQLDWFFYNYEKLQKAMDEGKEDDEHRRKLMEESKIRAEQWRQSGKQGIADNQRSSKE